MSFLGRFLVEQGAITEEQLEDGLRYQQEHNRRIGEEAVERGLLTPEEVRAICDQQRRDPRLFGDIAVEKGSLCRQSVDELLFFQKVHHTYLGEALLLLGHITREQHQLLMGRHYALRDNGRVSLRYLQDFFADNQVAETLFGAVSRGIRRFAGEELAIVSLGAASDGGAYRHRAVLGGVLLGGRHCTAAIGLSDPLAGKLVAGMVEAGDPKGLDGFFDAVLGFFGKMLRGVSLFLEQEWVVRRDIWSAASGDTLDIQGRTPSGAVGIDFWLEDVPA